MLPPSGQTTGEVDESLGVELVSVTGTDVASVGADETSLEAVALGVSEAELFEGSGRVVLDGVSLELGSSVGASDVVSIGDSDDVSIVSGSVVSSPASAIGGGT